MENPNDIVDPIQRFIPDLVELARDYLEPNGWFASLQQQQSIGKNGPIPWITYPAIEMLKRIASAHSRVFEYGAGCSSIWWAMRTSEVISVEYDPGWQRFLPQPLLERNRVHVIERGETVSTEIADWLEHEFFDRCLDPEPEYHFGPSPSVACRPFLAYASSILQYPKGYFDIIVIDGAARVLCAWLAARVLNQNGFIVFDNTDRVVYSKAYAELAHLGFARVDFWGPSPINRYESCTSLFTKTLSPFLPERRGEVEPRPEHFWR